MQNSFPIFHLDEVTVDFGSKEQNIPALNKISLKIEQGDIFGIIGQSGAGKSTLIRCLAKLLSPTSGRLLFHGKEMPLMTEEELLAFRKKTGMVFQHFNLLSSRTAAGNIAFPLELHGMSREEIQKRVDELLRLVGLEAKMDAYPAQLSGGEKQRVGIARALATRPEVLLCDEATSALDPKTTRDILNLLKSIHDQMGITMILITHQMEVVRQICTRVAILDKGCLAEHGSVADVFAKPSEAITQALLNQTPHDIPAEFLQASSPNRRLVRLHFKGNNAKEPIISHAVRNFNVDANIILGWIDKVQGITVGTLTVEFAGSPENIAKALRYLEEQNVPWEEIQRDR